MKCLDLIVKDTDRQEYIHSEYTQRNRYLHQCKRKPQNSKFKSSKGKRDSMVYFHIEMQDENGDVHMCPGQMSVSHKYSQEHNIYPVLLEILKGVTVAKH